MKTKTANEDATYTATLARVSGPAGKAAKPVATLTGTAQAYFRPGLNFKSAKPLTTGYYRFGVVLKAVTNPARTTTLTSKVFKVGKPLAAPKAKPKKKISAKKHKPKHRPAKHKPTTVKKTK